MKRLLVRHPLMDISGALNVWNELYWSCSNRPKMQRKYGDYMVLYELMRAVKMRIDGRGVTPSWWR